ncbi:unnamed protein product [Victoria cruziana]
MRPSDVGLESEAQLVRGWKPTHGVNGKKSRNGSHHYPPPITYLHLHECESFSTLHFGFYCLTGWPARLVTDGEMSAPCATTTLYPTTGGNIHCFKALTRCALFDVLSPPYSAVDGRHCTYYRKSPRKDIPGFIREAGIKASEFVWLEEHQPPDSFVVQRGLYKGRSISI